MLVKWSACRWVELAPVPQPVDVDGEDLAAQVEGGPLLPEVGASALCNIQADITVGIY